MTIVSTFIIPGSLWIEPVWGDNSFLVSGFNSYIEWIGDNNKFKLIGFSHYFDFVRPDPRNKNVWLVSVEGEWHTYIHGELFRIEDEEFNAPGSKLGNNMIRRGSTSQLKKIKMVNGVWRLRRCRLIAINLGLMRQELSRIHRLKQVDLMMFKTF